MRLKTLTDADLDDAQRALVARIAAPPRGAVRGPYLALLHSPKLCDRMEAMGRFVRFECSVPEKLRELAILVIARRWSAQFEWFAHEKHARAAGIADQAIEAIRHGRTPAFTDPAETTVYAFVHQLSHIGRVDDHAFAAAHALLGDVGIVDLVGLVGNYTTIAMTLNAFAIDVPEGTPRPLP